MAAMGKNLHGVLQYVEAGQHMHRNPTIDKHESNGMKFYNHKDMIYNTIPLAERKPRLRIIRNLEKPAKNGRLVNLRQTDGSSKVLMPPIAHQYIKPRDHDFF